MFFEKSPFRKPLKKNSDFLMMLIIFIIWIFKKMNHKQQTSFTSKEQAIKERKWYLFDAEGKVLGRFASEIAKVLRGKHKPNFTPNQDTGDGVIVINVEKLRVTGNKKAQKNYYSHSGYMGGLKETSYEVMQGKKPEYILKHAVKGMLPKTKLGRAQIKKMHMFVGADHNMQAQQPIQVTI